MAMRVTCSRCSASFAAKPEMAGRRVKCPRCGSPIQVPATTDSPSDISSPHGAAGSNGDHAPAGDRRASGKTGRFRDVASASAGSHAAYTQEVRSSATGQAAVTGHAGHHHPEHHLGSSEAVSVAALEHPEADDEGNVGFGGKERADNAEMDMTPMVDVTFLLLIFFMVTASFSMQKSMQLPRSKSEEPSTQTVQQDPEEEPIAITVIVDSFNTFTVETNEWIREAPSEQELLIALRDAMQGGSEQPQKLTVKAHVDAFHQKAVAALDAGAEVGIQQLQYSTITEDP